MKIIENSFENNKSNLKLLVLSDLHIIDKKSLKKINIIKKYLNKNKYDVICLVGDIIDSTNIFQNNEIYNKLLEFIKYLGSNSKTYIVYGSHDISLRDYKNNIWIEDYKTFKHKFIDIVSKYENVKILENEILDINKFYSISGYNPSFKYAYSKDSKNNLLQEGDFSYLKKLDKNKTNIFLCHYPNAVIELSNKNILNNIDVSISGHNHNGMVQIKIFPLEKLLNIFKQNNRGIITPTKSFKLKETSNLRGNIKLKNKNILIINPSVTSLAKCAGILHNFDCLFYVGGTKIDFNDLKALDK